MSLFPSVHSERIAPGSFQQPVPIPVALPGAPQLVTVCFNSDWLPYILGCLFQLTLPTTWQGTSDEVANAQAVANNLILIFQKALPGCQTQNPGFSGASVNFMFRQNPDNPCLLQTSVDGTNWCTWADLSKCTPIAQPGNKTIQPKSGDCSSFHGVIHPTDAWVLPVPVNAGDQVTVSNLYGAWSPTAFTTIWDCPDGNLFFSGNCIDGTSSLDSGAPMPTAPLNGTIVFDGTNYYDVSGAAGVDTPVTITIMPGVSNAQLLVRCNFHGGIDPAGEVNFDIKVCNNAATNWTYTFDFTLSLYSFAQYTIGGAAWGSWSAGIGLVSTDAVDSSADWRRSITMQLTGISPFALDSAQMVVDYVGPNEATAGQLGNRLRAISGGTPTVEWTYDILTAPTGSPATVFGAVAATGVDTLEIYASISEQNSSGALSGTLIIKSLTVSGHGPNPFVP
jgi:hypothetical protein